MSASSNAQSRCLRETLSLRIVRRLFLTLQCVRLRFILASPADSSPNCCDSSCEDSTSGATHSHHSFVLAASYNCIWRRFMHFAFCLGLNLLGAVSLLSLVFAMGSRYFNITIRFVAVGLKCSLADEQR